MTNRERSDRLLAGAEELYHDLENALERKSWNLTVRRAQEVVELVLKGLLGLMGIDYPKVHDVGKVFVKAIQEKGLALSEETLAEIQAISADLSRKRAPAFYFEEEQNESEARTALAQAQRVLELGRTLATQLKEPPVEQPAGEAENAPPETG